MSIYELKIPLMDADVTQLKIGDIIYLSGNVFTGRSRIHRYIFDESHSLPFDTSTQNVIIHVGPITKKEEKGWKLISFMPTSSLRFEKWGAQSVKTWGLKAIIGKTTMGEETMEAMKKYKCIHASPQCVSPNLWVDSIKIRDVELFDELGSIEASWQLTVDKLGPFVVDIDSNGNNYFEALDEVVAQNKNKVYEKLGIGLNFNFTKLY